MRILKHVRIIIAFRGFWRQSSCGNAKIYIYMFTSMGKSTFSVMLPLLKRPPSSYSLDPKKKKKVKGQAYAGPSQVGCL